MSLSWSFMVVVVSCDSLFAFSAYMDDLSGLEVSDGTRLVVAVAWQSTILVVPYEGVYLRVKLCLVQNTTAWHRIEQGHVGDGRLNA